MIDFVRFVALVVVIGGVIYLTQRDESEIETPIDNRYRPCGTVLLDKSSNDVAVDSLESAIPSEQIQVN